MDDVELELELAQARARANSQTPTPVPSLAPNAAPPTSEYSSYSPDAYDVAKFGVGMLGAVAAPGLIGGLLGRQALVKGAPYLARLGQYGYDAITSSLGAKIGETAVDLAKDPPTPIDYDSVQLDFGKLSSSLQQGALDVGVNSALGFALPAALDTYGSTIKRFSSPWKKAEMYQMEGAPAAVLNANAMNSDMASRRMTSMKSYEDRFLNSGVLEGIDTTSPRAAEQLGKNVASKLSELGQKQAGVYQAIQQHLDDTGSSGFMVTPEEVIANNNQYRKALTPDEEAEVSKILNQKFRREITPNDIFYKGEVPQNVTNAGTIASSPFGMPDGIGARPVGGTVNQPKAVAQLIQLKDEMQQISGIAGRYSANPMAEYNPAQRMQQIKDSNVSEAIKGAIQDKLEAKASQLGLSLSDINDDYAALSKFKPQIETFNNQGTQVLAPGMERSLINNVQSPLMAPGAGGAVGYAANQAAGGGLLSGLGALTGGAALAQKAKEAQTLTNALQRGPNAVQSLLDIKGVRQYGMPELPGGAGMANRLAPKLSGAVMPIVEGARAIDAVSRMELPQAQSLPGAVESQGLQALQMIGQNLPPTSDAPFAKELTPPLDPLRPVPNVAAIPRDINRLVPKQIFDILPQYAAPQDVIPLRIQFQKIMASGDKKQIGQFVSALSMKYPDMPIERGVITGKPSEFQLGNGTTVLLDDADKMTWLDEIRNSSLREDEKALRVAALYPHGTVYPMSVRLNNASVPQNQTPMTPDDLAVQNINQTMIFGPRRDGPGNSTIRMD
jgi:hypothetical protein